MFEKLFFTFILFFLKQVFRIENKLILAYKEEVNRFLENNVSGSLRTINGKNLRYWSIKLHCTNARGSIASVLNYSADRLYTKQPITAYFH